MGATLNLVPRALSLALELKPGKSALGTRLGYAKRMDEGGVCPSIPQVDPTLRLDNLERLCRSLVVKKKNQFMPDLPCEQSLSPNFSRKIEGDSACLQSALDQTPSK